MKKYCGVAFCILWCFVTAMPSGNSEDFTYDGSTPPLKTTPYGVADSLFPTLDVNGNTVTVEITGGVNPNQVYGAWMNNGSAIGNTVDFKQGTVENLIAGGRTEASNGNATGNTVSIAVGTLINGVSGVSSIFGGYVGTNSSGYASGNQVIMAGGTLNNMSSIHGAYTSTGEVFKNTVTISGGTYGNSTQSGVWGGLSTDGKVYENEVVLTGGTFGNGVQALIYGGSSQTGEVTQNKVTIDGATVGSNASAWIYGGYSTDGNAINNTVEYKSGTIASGGTGRIYGGYSVNGDVIENKAVISGGSVTWVYGGRANSASAGDATGNIIELSGGTVTNGMYAGYSTGGEATGNVVTMSGGNVTNHIRVGYAHGTGDASYNTATITGGTIGGTVYGGQANGGGNAEYNEISVSGASTSMATIYGGFTGTGGNASYNTVKATGGSISDFIFGGSAETAGDTSGNTVTISNITGTAALRIFGGTTANGAASQNQLSIENANFNEATAGNTSTGGNASSNTLSATGITAQKLTGGLSNAAAANNNTVNFYSGTVGSDNEGTLHGGWGYTSSYNNTVNIYGGSIGQGTIASPVSATVIGGAGTTGDVYNNQVNIYDGVIGDSSTNAYVYGGESSGTGTNVYNNTVTLAGGTVGNGGVSGSIYGGRQSSGTSGDAYNNSVIVTGGETDGIYGGLSKSGSASGNKVTVSGGTVNDWIVGGYTESASEASDNVVTLSGTEANLVNAQLYGWLGAATHSGNTLEVHEYNGTTVKSIGNFEIYDFLIPTSLASGGTALSVIDASDISNSEIKVNFTAAGNALQAGDQITLIHDTGVLTSTGINTETQARQGALLLYDLDIFSDANNVYIGVRSGQAAPESKSVSAGRIGSLAFLNQGHDVIVNSGFDAANAYLGKTGDGWSTPTFFGVVGGGHFRHKTGSHVDVDGVSTLLGMTWRNNGPCGSLLLGAFFEAGYADYDTRNAFASGTVRGDGDSRYFGGGILARYDWQNGLYVEASGRAGGVKNKFHSDLTDAFGNRAKYDINSPYIGAHAGVGYKWQINEKAILDLSTKYLWSRQSSDSAVVTGTQVDFDATNSHRVRTGARFAYAVNDCVVPYVGAAFEYEFNGKARGAISSYNFGVPSLKGGTGIGEVGVTMRRNNFSADLGVQGHIGRRDGVTGSLRVGWTF